MTSIETVITDLQNLVDASPVDALFDENGEFQPWRIAELTDDQKKAIYSIDVWTRGNLSHNPVYRIKITMYNKTQILKLLSDIATSNPKEQP